MNQLPLFIILISFFLHIKAEAQSAPPISSNDKVSSFRPSVAVVIGVLSIMFSLTFLLLIYAKFCHASTSDILHHRNGIHRNGIVHPPGLLRSNSRRFSGIDKAVIESLPFFRFSSLRGSKDGLECAVCLSKFEDTETLRLLPKCKHAFHVNCVDKWLENHSSCPLCRLKVDPQDISIFMYSSSMRISRTQSDLSEDQNLELFVRRESENHGGSFSVGSSFRMIENVAQEGISVQDTGNISDIEVKNRWSDVKSEDLLFLNSGMLHNAPRTTFSSSSSPHVLSSKHEKKMDLEESSMASRIDRSYSFRGSNHPSSSLIPTEKRSMSEIVNFSRFADPFGKENRSNESPSDSNTEDNMRKLWSPVARRTVEWLAGRERRSKQSQYSRQIYIV